MSGEASKRRRWLKWSLLVLLSLFCVGCYAIHHLRQTYRKNALRFQAAAADPLPLGATPDRARLLPAVGQLMTLDPTGRYLMNTISHKPVFITGDDAWSLQVQLSDEDIRHYLDDRASRDFNAIWVGLVDNTYSNHPPKDFYGSVPFNGPDFTNENPVYWARVDQTLQWAASRGITVFASPAFVGYGCEGGYCKSLRNSPLEVVVAYGKFLGNRYRSFPNIVWLIGGDADPEDQNVQQKLYMLAAAIRSVDQIHLITTEGYRGASSINVWSKAPWLDLDAVYSRPEELPAMCSADYRTGTYPVFLFEDWYEGVPQLDDRGIREEGYGAVLSGCVLGRFFGNIAIWNFNSPSESPFPWKEQLNSQGSVGQMWLGRLFRSREYWKLVPDAKHEVLIRGYDSRPWFMVVKESLRSFLYQAAYRMQTGSPAAARTSDGQTVIVYLPKGNASPITIAMDYIQDAGSRAKAWWFNPRDGSTQSLGIFATRGSQEFVAPDTQDWVLVIDSLVADLPAPGQTDLDY
jgi:Protein of unknown function (DUF4038)/Putative collagen-binding domain of a collagenase